MKKEDLKKGLKLYYSDGGLYGTIDAVLKRDCRIILPNGKKENRQISMILKMKK